MPAPLPEEDRLAIYDRHVEGERLVDIAREMGICYATARKWWRIGRQQGRAALVHRPRKTIGTLRRIPPKILERFGQLRQEHPTWGIPYVRQQLLQDHELTPQQRARIPSQSSFYRYVHATEDAPFGRRLKNHVPSTPLVTQATHAHHIWQMDLKEKCRVEGLENRITVLNARDIYSSVTVGSEVFELRRSNVSLTGSHIQAACRTCFSLWGLPDALRTDNGTCFLGNMAQSGFPSYLMLWLRGLGIDHESIRKGKPTQNGCVERYNRTYTNLVLRDGPFADVGQLRELSRTTVDFLNSKYPSRAGTCDGRPPLEAHPEALTPRRPYTPEREEELFSLSRVDEYLASFRWCRRADGVGQICLGRTRYRMGRKNKHRVFDVVFDPSDRNFVFSTPEGDVLVRQPAKGLDTDDITNIAESQRRRSHGAEKHEPLCDYDN